METKYKVINGTSYNEETPDAVIKILEESRINKTRLIFVLGDNQTGKAWGDIDEGHVGRSTGTVKIPLVINNSRSLGGFGLLDSSIVKIMKAKGKKVVYQHPKFSKEGIEFYGKNAKYV